MMPELIGRVLRQSKADKEYYDAARAWEEGDYGRFIDQFFLAIHSRYDIEKPASKRLFRMKLNHFNALREENERLKETLAAREKFFEKLATEYFVMGKECESEGLTAAAIKNYRKALELRPDYAKAQRRIKKLEKGRKINMRKLLYIICLSTLASCHLATNSTPSDADSVPQSVFAPLETDTVMPVNLQLVTGLQFPKYRVLSETPFVPDTASIAAYEETRGQWQFLSSAHDGHHSPVGLLPPYRHRQPPRHLLADQKAQATSIAALLRTRPIPSPSPRRARRSAMPR